MKRAMSIFLVVSFFIIFLSLISCSQSDVKNDIPTIANETDPHKSENVILYQEEGSYPSALMWNNSLYSPSIKVPIDESSIDSELGKIINQVQPMPKKDGEINDTQNFTIDDKIFSIKDTEITEAIAIMKDGKYYRINRSRSSLGIVWDNKMYDFEGNFDNENVNIDKEVGQIKKVGIDYNEASNCDITTNGYIGDLSIFQIGGKISTIENTDSNKAIAVEDKDGKFHKAVYIKKISK